MRSAKIDGHFTERPDDTGQLYLSAVPSGNTVGMCFCGPISHHSHIVIIICSMNPIRHLLHPGSRKLNLPLQGSAAVDSSRSSLVLRSVSRLRAGHAEGVHRHALNSNEPLVGLGGVVQR